MKQKIEIISSALVLLGAQPIASLNEGTEATVSSLLYDTTLESLLSQFTWRFATKKRRLARSTDKPLYGYAYSFVLPADLVAIYNSTTSNYEVFGKRIYANDTDISIEYRFKVEEKDMPPYFIEAFEYALASKFSIPITDSTSKAGFYADMLETSLKTAKFTDSSSRPSVPIQHSPLTDI